MISTGICRLSFVKTKTGDEVILYKGNRMDSFLDTYKMLDLETKEEFEGLCFVNLVEFDSEFGHRRDPKGYGHCIEEFDAKLGELLPLLHDDHLLIITADHGNDPTWTGSDHTREKVPTIFYSKSIQNGRLLDERSSFADMGRTICENFGIKKENTQIGDVINEIFEK